MFENLSTFARIRIAALSVIFLGSLALFVTGVPKLPRAAADNSAVQPGEGGDCDGFCGKRAGFQNVCLNSQCCGEGDSICTGNEQVTVTQVPVYEWEALGTCYVGAEEPIHACNKFTCTPSGASCAAGSCGAEGPPSVRIATQYEPQGTCMPTQ